MEPISPKHVTVTDPFWAPRIRTVTGTAQRTEQKRTALPATASGAVLCFYMDYNIISTMLSASAVGFCTSSPLMSRA